jgi:exonuclease VII large subunit
LKLYFLSLYDEEKDNIIKQLESQNQTLKEAYEYELRLKDEQIKELKERLEHYEQIKELKERLEHYEKTTEIKHKTKNSNDIQEYNFGSDLMVPIRNDGMINATALCKAGNKKINDFLRLQYIKDYLEALEVETGIPVSKLVESNIGGHSGTWVHRKVGYHLAQWISPQFAVKVSTILDELFITGSVVLGKEKSTNEIEIMYQNQIKELQTDYQKLLVLKISKYWNT